jgi:hypothetical protein
MRWRDGRLRPSTLPDLTLEGAPSKLRLGGPFDFFVTRSVTAITAFQPALRDNKRSDWGSFEACPSTKTGLEAAPKPFSEMFLELSS